MGSPHSHRKHCSLSALSAIPPANHWLPDIILHNCVTHLHHLSLYSLEKLSKVEAGKTTADWRHGEQCWLRHVLADQSEQSVFILKRQEPKQSVSNYIPVESQNKIIKMKMSIICPLWIHRFNSKIRVTHVFLLFIHLNIKHLTKFNSLNFD